ncbi:hypothetical protein CcaverHIS631_0700540 [Cutaneotrichosporon cavernicola]|nr:hypothetical protein CcaverHIS631_0700540 [Cutaneotrichosporon cavernicola]BEJ10018.1 hypothetical protein CcaverHIS641_0700530 [Cutaneotrichosporon cavernicola]
MLAMLALLAILLLSTVLAAPHANTYALSWTGNPGSSGWILGVPATFGNGQVYNYTRVPDGTPVILGFPAAKFFWYAQAGNIGSPGELQINHLGFTQCLDAGGGWDGQTVRIQKCTGKWAQQWIVEGRNKQVRLANSSSY